jgi:hypothetical protein
MQVRTQTGEKVHCMDDTTERWTRSLNASYASQRRRGLGCLSGDMMSRSGGGQPRSISRAPGGDDILYSPFGSVFTT